MSLEFHLAKTCFWFKLSLQPIRLIFRRGDDKLYYLRVKRTQGPVYKALSATLIPDDGEDEDMKEKGLKQTTRVETVAVEKPRKLRSINIMVAHELLGHPGEQRVLDAANFNEWKLVGACGACKWCDQAKARQKNIATVSQRKTTQPGEMLHLDLTGPFKATPSNSRFIVDDFTNRKSIFLLQQKSQVVEEVDRLILCLKGRSITCKYIRMDGGGENQPIRKLCDLHGMVAEYTARATPQQNGKVERAIATLKDRATADILRLKCDIKWWGANMIHKTVCDNLIPRGGFKNAYEPFGKQSPVKENDMVPFGAQGVMAIRKKMKKNWTAKGEEVFMVGYTVDAPSDCYNVVKISNGRVVASRDIKCPYWKTSQDMTKPPDEGEIYGIKQKTTPEKDVDFVIPDNSDSGDSLSDDNECSTRGSNNHQYVSDDSTANHYSERESLNPSLQSERIDSILVGNDDNAEDQGHHVQIKPKVN